MYFKTIILTLLFGVILYMSPLLAVEVPYTLEDRDRLINVEVTLRELRALQDGRFDQVDKRFDQVDKRFEQIDKRFDSLNNFIMWGFGVIFMGIFALIGFVLWDRRTALAPAIRKNKELEEKEEMIEKVLKELAREDTKVAKAMKHAGFHNL